MELSFSRLSVPIGLVDDPSVEDYEFNEKLTKIIDERRTQLLELKQKKGDIKELYSSWKQIVIVIDKLTEFLECDRFTLIELLERVIKKERDIKIAIIITDNSSELQGNWESLSKAIRGEQIGILLGSIKEQELFNIRLPYGAKEKKLEIGDGYIINRSEYKGIRTAYYY